MDLISQKVHEPCDWSFDLKSDVKIVNKNGAKTVLCGPPVFEFKSV